MWIQMVIDHSQSQSREGHNINLALVLLTFWSWNNVKSILNHFWEEEIEEREFLSEGGMFLKSKDDDRVLGLGIFQK